MRLSFYKNLLYKRLSNNKVNLVYVPLGLYWFILFILTSIPTDALPTVGGIDKIEHFLAYAVLAFMLGLAFYFQSAFHLSLKLKFLFSFSISLTYGILDELHQIPIPGRYFDWWDLFSNFIGILIGLTLLKWFINVGKSDLGYSEDGTKDSD